MGVNTVIASSLPTMLSVAEVDEHGAARYRFYTHATAAAALTAPGAVSALPSAFEILYVGSLGLPKHS